MTTFARALDGARLVQTYTDGAITHVMVWHGGTQYNCYAVSNGEIEEWYDGVQTISDEEGQPVSREEISDSMDRTMERVWDEQ